MGLLLTYNRVGIGVWCCVWGKLEHDNISRLPSPMSVVMADIFNVNFHRAMHLGQGAPALVTVANVCSMCVCKN